MFNSGNMHLFHGHAHMYMDMYMSMYVFYVMKASRHRSRASRSSRACFAVANELLWGHGAGDLLGHVRCEITDNR